jgi:hypothetical protein
MYLNGKKSLKGRGERSYVLDVVRIRLFLIKLRLGARHKKLRIMAIDTASCRSTFWPIKCCN